MVCMFQSILTTLLKPAWNGILDVANRAIMCLEVVMLRDVGDVLLRFCVVNMSTAMNSCGQRLACRHCDFNFCTYTLNALRNSLHSP